MNKHTHILYFTDHSTPSFLGLDFSGLEAAKEHVRHYFKFDPTPSSGVLIARATAAQVAAIRRAEDEGREYDIYYVHPASPEDSARVKVRTYPSVLSKPEALGVIYHLPDGRRVMRHQDGRLEDLTPLGGPR